MHEWGQCYGAVEILENAANLNIIIILITKIPFLFGKSAIDVDVWLGRRVADLEVRTPLQVASLRLDAVPPKK
jgi:hypothetical protein